MIARRSLAVACISIVVCSAPACSRSDTPSRAESEAQAAALPDSHAHADTAAQAVTLCEHGVPADLCTHCNPDLIPVFQAQGDWCEKHEVPDTQCFQCNPKLTFSSASAPADWCREHAVPESKCTKCKPALVAKFIEAGDYCREHGYPQSVCPFCHPELARAIGASPPAFPTPGTRVRLASAQTARDAGIETQRAETSAVAPTLEVVGRLAFDHNRHAQLATPADSMILEVSVDVGDDVRASQAVATLASSNVGADQARLAAARARIDTARAALEREQRLVERGVAARKHAEAAQSELATAQAEHDAARSSLAAAGAGSGGAGGRYVLTAPFAGTVVSRDAVAGRSASAGQVLMEIADLSTMWALLEIPESEAASVHPGLPVEIVLEGARAKPLTGTIARVGASVDPSSRTVVARVELANDGRRLKAGAFVRARIALGPEGAVLLVPAGAIQRAENRSVAFVERVEGVYEPVVVEIGRTHGGSVEIVSGLTAGDTVVTTGAFLLKTEVSKESIGAGCCETGADG